MPKDFNDLLATDRQFKVRDKTFTFVDVKPEVLTLFDAEAAVNGNGKEEDDALVWRLLDAQIMLFLDESGQKEWQDLRARDTEPVTIAQMNGILTWLLEQQTGRPTETPSPSASGRGRTAATSKAA